MRRWLFSLLLACLLVSQQGLLLHGLGHSLASLGAAQAAARDPGRSQAQDDSGAAPAADEVCGTCLAFVQLAGAVSASVTPATLLAGLSYALTAAKPISTGSTTLPTPRSRGPPTAT